MTDIAMLPESWRGVLGDELQQPYFKELTEFVEEERARTRAAWRCRSRQLPPMCGHFLSTEPTGDH